jgi:hypothetical protein
MKAWEQSNSIADLVLINNLENRFWWDVLPVQIVSGEV